MQIDRSIETQVAPASSPVPPMQLSALLGRKSNSVWAKPSGEGLVITAATAAVCLLCCVIVEVSLAHAFVP